MKTYKISVKGVRDDNEDEVDVIENINKNNDSLNNINFYAVYDGHGGNFVSMFLKKNFKEFFIRKINKMSYTKNNIVKFCNYLTDILNKKHFDESKETGSTCLCMIIEEFDNKRVITAVNIGDSRLVVCRNKLARVITRDHKPEWPDEKYRIESLGGVIKSDYGIWRIGDYSVSRAFGDLNHTKYISNKPDIYKFSIIKGDMFSILACDGLWDVMEPQEVVNFILLYCYDYKKKTFIESRCKKVLEDLVNLALKKSTDNISIILTFF